MEGAWGLDEESMWVCAYVLQTTIHDKTKKLWNVFFCFVCFDRRGREGEICSVFDPFVIDR